MNIDALDTAIVLIDPQNDVLSEKGIAWPLVGESVRENNTIENIERILKTSKARGFEVFISTSLLLSDGQRMEAQRTARG